MLVRPDQTSYPDNADSLLEAVLADEQLQQATHVFLQAPRQVPAHQHKTVCVFQGEQAFIRLEAGEEVTIGSEDATTCIIAVLLDKKTGAAWAAHYDEPQSSYSTSFQEAARQMLQPALYLVGAYDEPSGVSRTVCDNILKMAHAATPQPLELRLACVSAANTVYDGAGRPRPAAHNLAVNCLTGQPWPAGFEDRGPDLDRRFASPHCAPSVPQLQHIIAPCGQRLRLPGFDATVPAHHVRYCKAMLGLDDATFLQHASTSPDCERDNFVADIKAAYRWLLGAQRSPKQPEALYEWDGSQGRWRLAGTAGDEQSQKQAYAKASNNSLVTA